MKKIRLVGFIVALATLTTVALADQIVQPSLSDAAGLQAEAGTISQELSDAQKLDSSLTGGLIKSLIEERIEILKINSALIEQRLLVLKTNAPMTTKANNSQPDAIRAAQLTLAIADLDKQITQKKAESAQYEGGLIKALIDSTVATLENNRAMLQTEYLKANYGIYWLPVSSTEAKVVPATDKPVTDRSVSLPSTPPVGQPDAATILVPTASNKDVHIATFEDNDIHSGIYFDFSWNTDNLPKPTRAVKGRLLITDLFGETKRTINWTLNDTLTPGKTYTEHGVGFDYNQFSSEDTWVRQTDLKDMKFKFIATDILYQDGTAQSFPQNN